MQSSHGKSGARDTRRTGGRQNIFAGLDVGSSKVACLIARTEGIGPDGSPILRVIGSGQHLSRGVKAGTIVGMDAAEGAIRAAVAEAEAMAGVTLRRISVALNCGAPVSQTASVQINVAGREIGDRDLRMAIRTARDRCQADSQDLIFATPVSYAIDGAAGIRDPRGMFGDELNVKMHLVTARPSAVRTLELCVERCHLEVQDKILSAFAAGLAAAVPDERDLGTVVVDIGGGTTTVGVFSSGMLMHSAAIPAGGYFVTTDIAQGLSTTIAQAERLKTLYGSVISGAHDDRDMIVVQQLGDDEQAAPARVARKMLTQIIRPRAEEILEIARDKLRASGLEAQSGRSVILTGGASQLNGMRELAQRVFGRQARLGRPLRLSGLPDVCSGGAFSVCGGLILKAAGEAARMPVTDSEPQEAEEQLWPAKKLAGIGRWLKSRL
jgi:cell division protein FtsA